MEIDLKEYEKLKEIEKKYTEQNTNTALDIAVNVNNASKKKVVEIESISSLVNEFI